MALDVVEGPARSARQNGRDPCKGGVAQDVAARERDPYSAAEEALRKIMR